MLLYRQESHSYRVFARSGQLKSKSRALAREKLMRNLNQDSGAVTGFRIAPTRSTVGEIDENLDSLLDDLMALLTANAGDKTHAASVVFVRWVVKTLGRRQTVLCFPTLQWNFLRGVL
jgi:hypothetical protein